MSSPITSVPDPSESSALASIITQVQPGQVPTAVRGARPTQPAKKTATDASRKKKKKKSKSAAADAASAAQAEDAAQLRSQDEAVAAAARLGSEAAQSQARAHSTANASTTVVSADGQAQESHSHQASSTLVGTSSAENTLRHGEAVPASNSMGEAAEPPSLDKGNVPTTASSEATVEKDGLINLPPCRHASGDAAVAAPVTSAPAPAAATRPAQTASAPAPKTGTSRSKPGKPTFGQKLVAFLTCSSVTSATVKEEMSEKTRGSASVPPRQAPTRNNAKGTAAASKVVVPPRTSNSKGSAPGPHPDYPTTAGGGAKLPRSETGDVMSGAVVPPGASFVTAEEARKSRASSLHHSPSESSLSDDDEDDEDDEDEMDLDEDEYLTDDQTEEQRLIMQGGIGIPVDEFGNPQPLLPAIGEHDTGRKCLVLDLDETLVHSSFKMIQNADFIVPVEIDGTVHNVYVIKRPGVDEFMQQMGLIYEVVVFTASLSKYADPVLDMLDIHHAVRHRLFRESCYNHKGNYVKDLSQLGREIGQTIIIDNSPASYIFHANNAVPISSWFNDPHDTELTDLCPFLEDLTHVHDVRAVLDGGL